MPDNVSDASREIYAGARIMVVDDHDANLRLLRDILKKAGYTNIVLTAEPQEVAGMCVMLQPDLILLDLMMPYMDVYCA